MKTKTRKTYILQHKDKSGTWEDVNCYYNGFRDKNFRAFIGRKVPPTLLEIEGAMKAINDFAKENYRVAERLFLCMDL